MIDKKTYIKKGKGMPVVLLHGFCENKDIFKEFIPELSENYQLIIPDLPGFGKNAMPTQNISISNMADYVQELLAELDIQECIMIGHSMGGYVALEYASKYSDGLLGLGLLHSTCLPDNEEKKQNRNKTIEFVDKNGVASFIESFTPNLFSPSFKEDLADEIAFATNIALSTPQNTITDVTKALRERKDHSITLKEAAFPVLFIFGKEDTILPLDQHLPIVSLPNYAMVNILGYTGHMSMLELPGETMYYITCFLDFIENA
jgi:pimeloyl-ACP methyl ester carboxylesterase